VWHLHFGRGLVETPNDFGRMGSGPSHPELLDWLAVRVPADDAQGSFKALHRLLVLSDTYAQSSRVTVFRSPGGHARRRQRPALAHSQPASMPRRCVTRCSRSSGRLDFHGWTGRSAVPI
jgi:hypothetical protein